MELAVVYLFVSILWWIALSKGADKFSVFEGNKVFVALMWPITMAPILLFVIIAIIGTWSLTLYDWIVLKVKPPK